MDSGLKTSFRASRPCLKHLHKRPSLARGLFLHLTEYDSWTETFTNESKKNQNIQKLQKFFNFYLTDKYFLDYWRTNERHIKAELCVLC